jgi:WD40 repeat protein
MKELANDLDNFLSDMPISARPVSRIEKGIRWCRKNKLIAILGSSIFVTLLALLITVSSSRSRLMEMLITTQQAKSNEARSLADSRESLWEATISEARAWQSSRRIGQKSQSLEAIKLAQTLLDEVEATPERKARLRDTALAAIPLVDIQPERKWRVPTGGVIGVDQGLNRLATFTEEGMIVVSEGEAQRTICELPANDARELVLSPNGKWLAIIGEHCDVVAVDDLDNRIPIADQSRGWWAFSWDSNQLIGFDNDGLLIFDLATQKDRRINSVGYPKVPLAISPDGQRIAIANGSRLRIFDLSSTTLINEIKSPDSSLIGPSMAWHPNSQFLAAAKYADDKLVLWNVETGQPIRAFAVSGQFFNLHFDSSGQYLFACGLWGGSREVFNVESESSVLRLPSRGGELFGQSDDDSTLILAGLQEDSKEISRFETQHALQILHSAFATDVSRFQTIVSPDNRWIGVHTEEGIELFDAETGHSSAVLPIGRLAFDAILFDQQGALWGTMEHGWIRWKLNNDRLAAPDFFDADPSCVSIAVSPDGQWGLMTDGNRVGLRNFEGNQRKIELGALRDVRNGSFSPDSKWVAAGSWNQPDGVRVWRIADAECVASLAVGNNCQVKFSPDGKWLFTAPRGGEIWETDSWKCCYRLESPDSAGTGFSFDFSPDSSWCVHTHGSGLIKLVGLAKGDTLGILTDPDQDSYFSLAVAKNQNSIVGTTSGRAGLVKRWDLVEIQQAMKCMGLEMPELGAGDSAQSPNRRKPASTCNQSMIEIETNPRYEDLVLQHMLRASAADRLQSRWDQSLHKLELAFQQMPNNASINNNLAWFLVTAPTEYQDPQRSISLARKSLELEDNQAAWNTLGTALFRDNQFREAIEAIKKSLGDGSDPFAAYDYFVLACCHAELEQLEAAEDCLNRGLESLSNHRTAYSTFELKEIESFQREATRSINRLRAKGNQADPSK